MPRQFWQPEQLQIIRWVYPHVRTADVAAIFGRTEISVYHIAKKLGLEKTPEYLASPAACRLRREDSPGIAYRYPKGHVPANKGQRRPGYAPGRMSDTQFKKGQKSQNWMPIGSKRFSKDGYLQRKVTDTGYPPRDWKAVHTLLWEAKHGAVPRGHALAFKDGNKANIKLRNLELITRAELMRRNTIHTRYPKELVQVIMLNGALKRKLRRRNEELAG